MEPTPSRAQVARRADRRRRLLAVTLGLAVDALILAAAGVLPVFSSAAGAELPDEHGELIVFLEPAAPFPSVASVEPSEPPQLGAAPEHGAPKADPIDSGEPEEARSAEQTEPTTAEVLSVLDEGPLVEDDRPVAPSAAASNESPPENRMADAGGVSEEAYLRSRIDILVRERLRYPQAARRRNIEGSVTVALTISELGELLSLELVESSGSDLLDGAARTLFAGMFPLDLSGRILSERRSLRVRISYTLKS